MTITDRKESRPTTTTAPQGTVDEEGATTPDQSRNGPLHLYQFDRLAIKHLLESSPQQIARLDIAEMNLICAYGLPGAEKMDFPGMLKLLDLCAKRCRIYITQQTPRYNANSEQFGSFATFLIRSMVEVIVRQLRARYNSSVDGEPGKHTSPITDPADTFIHGLLGPRRTGTCATFPVLLIAVARRLGYPLKLAIAPEHLFCRWDSPEERFNIEYDERGVAFYNDEHYKEWPFKWPPEVHEQQRLRPYFLLSLAPQQELAHFTWARAYHLNAVGGTRRMEALATMQSAQILWPTRTHAVWTLHLTTKALYPERTWPHAPCEETAGRAAIGRLVREKGITFVEHGITRPIERFDL